MNCHVHGGNSGNLSMFHLRGEGGGTILNRDGKLRKLALKNGQMISAAVYGDFHPDGRYGVFSSNVIIPMFHTESNRRLEVYDTVSDLAVADFDGNRMIVSPLTADSTVLETFPLSLPTGNGYITARLQLFHCRTAYSNYAIRFAALRSMPITAPGATAWIPFGMPGWRKAPCVIRKLHRTAATCSIPLLIMEHSPFGTGRRNCS